MSITKPIINNTSTQTEGRLKIEIGSYEEFLPVTDAVIQVLDNGKVIDELKVDSSGQTQTISLQCPDVELSEEPQSLERPYRDISLHVMAEGYEPQNVFGVQVFADSTAIQEVNLISQKDTSNIIIPAHTLWGNYPEKIPESPVKELPDPTGYVVLDQPVIPAYVVVHTAKPQSYGENLWIPFKDYVKNVASCEIYSTWSTETIKANVLAIISFVLNRVFTEWYRGKGYNFTITNSTAYDQAFVYGRTIYKEIAVIVDQIFSQYVTRPNIRQPLFTQFCDGKNSSCPNWLSQWGSKSLGDKGYNHVNILKYYYGQDIYLTQAEKVSGVPISWPGSSLQVGSRGKDVLVVQNQLNAISKNFPAIPKVSEDGIYGPKTRDSVKVFQKVFDLPQSGVVDYATWYKMSNIYVAVQLLS